MPFHFVKKEGFTICNFFFGIFYSTAVVQFVGNCWTKKDKKDRRTSLVLKDSPLFRRKGPVWTSRQILNLHPTLALLVTDRRRAQPSTLPFKLPLLQQRRKATTRTVAINPKAEITTTTHSDLSIMVSTTSISQLMVLLKFCLFWTSFLISKLMIFCKV